MEESTKTVIARRDPEQLIAELDPVVDWMRAKGVVGLRAEGVELRLDPSWHEPEQEREAPEPEAKSPEDIDAEIKRARASRDARMFGHVRHAVGRNR